MKENTQQQDRLSLKDKIKSYLAGEEDYIARLEKVRDKHFEDYCKKHPKLSEYGGSSMACVKRRGVMSGGLLVQAIRREYEYTYDVSLDKAKDKSENLHLSLQKLLCSLEEKTKEAEVYKAYYRRDENAFLAEALKEAPEFRTPLHEKNFHAECRREYRMKVNLDPDQHLPL